MNTQCFYGRCEICGLTAVMAVRDVIRKDEHGSSMYTYEPDGPVHLLCSFHQRDSRTRTVHFGTMTADDVTA